MEQLLEKGASEAVAQAKGFNALLPDFIIRLRRLYLHYLKWFRRVKRDPVHEAVMKTQRCFIDEEEDMDYVQAADAAVNRRKFLFNRIFKPRPVPKNRGNCIVTNVNKSDCHVNSPGLLLLQLLS